MSEDKQVVTTQDTQGNDRKVEVHGRKGEDRKGVTIIGGSGARGPVRTLSSRDTGEKDK